MRQPGGHIKGYIAWLAGVLLATPQIAHAQDTGGLEYRLSFDEQVRFDDDDLFARSTLGFGITSVTRRDRFELDLGGAIDKGRADLDTLEFDEPSANLLYERDTRNALFQITGSFSRNDIRNSVLVDGPDGLGLVIDEGQQENLRAGLRFEWGREAAFGGSVEASYADRRFLDTDASGLLDQETFAANLSLRFEIDETVSASVRLRFTDLDREDGSGSENLGLSLGASAEITPTLSSDISLGFSRVDQNEGGRSEGLTADTSLTQDLPNGSLSGRLATDIGENGRRTTFEIERSVDLRDGVFEASIGVGEQQDATRALFGLRFSRENPRSNITFNFGQAFSGSTQGDPVFNSNLGLNYRHTLTTRTGYSLGLDLRETTNLETRDPSTQQLTVNLSVDHALTDLWSIVAGVTHTRRRTEGGDTTVNDVIFLGLRTELSWRP